MSTYSTVLECGTFHVTTLSLGPSVLPSSDGSVTCYCTVLAQCLRVILRGPIFAKIIIIKLYILISISFYQLLVYIKLVIKISTEWFERFKSSKPPTLVLIWCNVGEVWVDDFVGSIQINNILNTINSSHF